MRQLWRKFLRVILFSRFEPVETVLSVILLATSIWLIFPEWDFSALHSATGLSIHTEAFIGMSIALTSLFHLFGMARTMNGSMSSMRYSGLMGVFMGYCVVDALYLYSAGATAVGLIPYVGLTILAAISYLSVGVSREIYE